MKKSILSFILGAAIVSGIIFTCGSFITEPDCEKCISEYLKGLDRHYDTIQTLIGTNYDNKWLNPIDKVKLLKTSGKIEHAQAEKYNKCFVDATDFLIPCAWTFDAVDVRAIARTHDSVVTRIKLYAAIDSASNQMTLVMLGLNPHDSDIMEVNSNSVLLEYADPCPPKCGKANSKLFTNCIFKKVRNATNQDASKCDSKFSEVTPDWIKRNRQ